MTLNILLFVSLNVHVLILNVFVTFKCMHFNTNCLSYVHVHVLYISTINSVMVHAGIKVASLEEKKYKTGISFSKIKSFMNFIA